jgi:acyl-coenzyme A thioesterase PaaI-like protein
MKMTPALMRFILNVYPPYLGAGIHVNRIADDWKTLDVSMKLHWYNQNVMKTHFGGSLYSMVDPHLMLMHMQILGKEYIVWDKAAKIDFIRPGKGKVSAHFHITEHNLETIFTGLETQSKVRPEYEVAVIDESGELVAKVTKILYVRRKKEL